ncbi:MAG TPA: 30S ribosomal protein S1 [Solibacterales bacterium]|nr:30S ribosomal protein S1 [Bryobacterales bacterium]
MPNQTELDRALEAPATPEQASGEETSFGELLSQFEQTHPEKQENSAEGREATVVSVSGESVFLDIGQKIEGRLPLTAFQDKSGQTNVQPGQKLKVNISGRDEEGYYKLSLLHIEQPKDWSALETAFQEKRTIAGRVTGLIKGGVTVDVGTRAFMPASRSGTRDAADLAKLVGQEIECRVIKLDKDDDDVVVDRRAILEEQAKVARESRYNELQEGQVVHATVRSLVDYAAYLDIGGIDGMLHVSEMSYGRINKPADVLSIGQQVDVQILKVDRSRKKVSLGMKQLQKDPWVGAAERYHVGDRIHGKVSRVADFGAFVELEPGLDGLIHLSEMSWSKKVRKPSDVVKPGETVEVVVLAVKPEDKRVSLGLKQALGDPWEDAEKKYPVGATVEAPVISLTKFGAFVQLDEHIEGMIHVGDISNDKRINHPQDELKVGQVVRAQVLEFDRERRRLRLGMKQLIPTASDEYIAEHKEGDTVTGRVADVARNRATVELGEGVLAYCPLAEKEAREEKSASAPRATDVSALSSMLAAKWKSGPAGQASQETKGGKEVLKAGQVRSFKIARLDAEKKRIDLEMVVT